jgi:hypothetical protein
MVATVDVYDVATSQWTVMGLSQARSKVGASSTGWFSVFAGGTLPFDVSSNVVDIVDLSTNTWKAATLSMGRAIPIGPEVAARCAQDALQFHPAHGAGQDVFDAMVRLALRQDPGFQA